RKSNGARDHEGRGIEEQVVEITDGVATRGRQRVEIGEDGHAADDAGDHDAGSGPTPVATECSRVERQRHGYNANPMPRRHAGHEQLRIADGELDNTSELRRQIVTTIRRVRPDAVVCPDPTAVFFGDRYFNHHDHREVGWATLDAVAPAASNPHYFPNAGPVH